MMSLENNLHRVLILNQLRTANQIIVEDKRFFGERVYIFNRAKIRARPLPGVTHVAIEGTNENGEKQEESFSFINVGTEFEYSHELVVIKDPTTVITCTI